MSQPPPATERVYLSSASWLPAIAAAGLAGLVIGLYAWWPYAAAGAIALLISLLAWLNGNRREITGMPTHQETDTAPIPLSGRE